MIISHLHQITLLDSQIFLIEKEIIFQQYMIHVRLASIFASKLFILEERVSGYRSGYYSERPLGSVTSYHEEIIRNLNGYKRSSFLPRNRHFGQPFSLKFESNKRNNEFSKTKKKKKNWLIFEIFFKETFFVLSFNLPKG